MSAKAFVDTNILVYAFDRSAGRKHLRAKQLVRELWETQAGVISTQVLQELAFCLRRKVANPLSADATRRVLQRYLGWTVWINTPQSTLEALEIEERYRISFWDALIVHAAHASGSEIIYTEDLSNNQNYGSVRVVSPFPAPSP